MFNTLKVTSIFYQMNKCFIKSNKIDKKRSITEKKYIFISHFVSAQNTNIRQGPSILNYSILGMQ